MSRKISGGTGWPSSVKDLRVSASSALIAASWARAGADQYLRAKRRSGDREAKFQ
jgi:hypothetical protein